MSLRKAINDKCVDCIVDEEAGGTWRQQVTLCPSTDCPLYPVRPLSEDHKQLLDAVRSPHEDNITIIRRAKGRESV